MKHDAEDKDTHMYFISQKCFRMRFKMYFMLFVLRLSLLRFIDPMQGHKAKKKKQPTKTDASLKKQNK